MVGVGALLRQYREAAGFSQEELAERAGLSARAVSDLERGLRRNPYPSTIRQLALALDLPPEHRSALLAAARGGSGGHRSSSQQVVEQGAYLGAQPAAGMVGRLRELAELRDAVADARSGSGQLVLLAGEAGIGKTRLAQELAAMAAAMHFRISTGRCYEPYQGVAFYPFLDALANLYAHAPADVRQTLPDRWPYMARLLPDSFPRPSGGPSDSPDELQRLLRSVGGFVRACAETSPVAVLIDDLQWADGASIDLLQHLVRHTRGHAVLIGGTVREPGLSSTSSLRRAMVDLLREGLLRRVRVERFERADTAALIAERLEPGEPASELIDLIHAVSDGNPFFAIEVLQTLRARGELVPDGSTWIGKAAGPVTIPESVRESIMERYRRLSQRSAQVVDAAAALGQAFLADHVAAVAGVDEDVVEVALEEIAAAGFIRAPGTSEGDAVEQYAFVHALTQQTLYEHLSRQRRRRLHLRAADFLEQMSMPVRVGRAAEVARHLQLAKEMARAVPYLLLAGDQAEAVFAHTDATTHYQSAASLAAEIGDRAAEAQALFRLGKSWLAGGHPERALQHFERAVRIYHELEDIEAEGETLAWISQVYFARGNWDAGIERLPALIERLERREPSRALARLYACLAAVMPARPSERIAAAARASDLARTLADDDLMIQAEANRGFVLMLAGRLPDARAALEAILPFAESRRAYDALPMILGALGEITKLQGDLCAYARLAERAVARAEEGGDTVALIGALSGVAESQFLSGDWVAARQTYERAAREGADLDAAWYRGFVQLGLTAIDIAQGSGAGAEQQLAECLVDSPRLGHQNRREHALRLLARRDLLAEAPTAALARLEDVVRAEGDEHAGTQTLRAWALLESGEFMSAAEMVARAVQLASAQGNQLDLCEALVVRGDVERHLGEVDRAAGTLLNALDLAQGMPCPYLEARARYGRARVLFDLRLSNEASLELQAAVSIFNRLGARPYLRKADRLRAKR